MRGIFIKTTSAHVLHRVENTPVRDRANVVHGNDSGMFQSRDDLRFTHHALPQIAGQIGSVEDFDCDAAVELSVFGEINSAHAAGREFVEQPILRRTEVGLYREFAKMVQPGIGNPFHFTSTPSSERASLRNSSSVAVISRSFSITMRRKSRRAAAR